MRVREVWIQVDGLAKQLDGRALLSLLFLVQQVTSAQVEVVRGHIARALSMQTTRVPGQQLDLEGLHHVACDFLLDGEDVLCVALEDLRPEVKTILDLDELCSDAHALAGFAHATFEKGLDIEESAHL